MATFGYKEIGVTILQTGRKRRSRRREVSKDSNKERILIRF